MRIRFFLPIEPFSLNRMYYRDKRHKTSEFRDWEKSVLHAMKAPFVQEQLKKIRDYFDPNTHYFSVRLTYIFPQEVLYNKQGLVSSRAEDLTNIEKPLIDLLFLPKYHVQPFPGGCQNVNADDKYILQLTSRKKSHEDKRYVTEVRIAVLTRAKLVNQD